MNKYDQRGGKSDPRNKLYNSATWRKLRRQVLSRDGHACRICGAPASTVHHLEAVMDGGEQLNPDNLITACLGCHGSVDSIRNHRGGRLGNKRATPNAPTRARKNVKSQNRFMTAIGVRP